MKIAVIGANGQLGTELVCEAEGQGHEVIALTHDELEVSSAAEVRLLLRQKPDAVINTAAMHDLAQCEECPACAWRVNTAIPLVRLLGEADCAYLYVSTDFVFDGDAGDYDEFAACRPISVYGKTKRAGELAALSHVDKAAVCRISYLFGKVGCRAKGGGNFVDFILGALHEGKRLDLDADTSFSPTYAPDAAVQILRVLELVQAGKRGVFHCANTGECSHCDFGVTIAELMGIESDFHPRFGEPDPLRPKKANLLNTRIEPAPAWSNGLQRYLKEKGEL